MAEVELPDPEELEERAERTFSRRVALVTAIYAVVLAIMTWLPPRADPSPLSPRRPLIPLPSGERAG